LNKSIINKSNIDRRHSHKKAVADKEENGDGAKGRNYLEVCQDSIPYGDFLPFPSFSITKIPPKGYKQNGK
jgi:hypothetical protein